MSTVQDERTTKCTDEIAIECSNICPRCNGNGIIYPSILVGLNVTGEITCPKCNGSRKL